MQCGFTAIATVHYGCCHAIIRNESLEFSKEIFWCCRNIRGTRAGKLMGSEPGYIIHNFQHEGRGFETRWCHCFFFFNLPNLSTALTLGFTLPITEMSIRNRKNVYEKYSARPERKAHKQRHLSRQCWILDSSQAYRPAWPVMGMVLLLLGMSVLGVRILYRI
jgi:hypothetical protein